MYMKRKRHISWKDLSRTEKLLNKFANKRYKEDKLSSPMDSQSSIEVRLDSSPHRVIYESKSRDSDVIKDRVTSMRVSSPEQHKLTSVLIDYGPKFNTHKRRYERKKQILLKSKLRKIKFENETLVILSSSKAQASLILDKNKRIRSARLKHNTYNSLIKSINNLKFV